MTTAGSGDGDPPDADVSRGRSADEVAAAEEHAYVADNDGERLGMTPYRDGVNAYLRWRLGDRSGRRGGVTADGRFVFDADDYVASGGEGETLPLDGEVHAAVLEELEALRDEGVVAELGDDAAEAFEQDKRVFERARELLEADETPAVEEGEAHTVEVEIGERGIDVELRAVAREGLAEVLVSVGDKEGYAPRYELGERRLTLPAMGTWRFTRQIEVPDEVAEELLDDLTALQEQLNARREAYDDAVERARDEILPDGS